MEILILKTGALGDVLRTTSILPGLLRTHAGARVTWVVARAGEPLLASHPDVHRVIGVDPKDAAALAALGEELAATSWTRVLSFDDEEPMCALATKVSGGGARLSGAYLADGERVYTDDVAPWFDMGLISRFGKEEADRRKLANTESHPAIFARMLEIEMGEPRFELGEDAESAARAFLAEAGLEGRALIGLNTGAGGRWASKRLDEARTAALVDQLHAQVEGAAFLLLGGADELERNAEIRRRVTGGALVVDPARQFELPVFGALVGACRLLVTSDSLALHVGIARRTPIVVFFAPTSATEIELYGLGEKVESLAPDAGTYRPDVDTSTLTVERLEAAAVRTLAAHPV